MRAILAALLLASCAPVDADDESIAVPANVTTCTVTEQQLGATVICDNGISFYAAHDDDGGWARAGCFWAHEYSERACNDYGVGCE